LGKVLLRENKTLDYSLESKIKTIKMSDEKQIQKSVENDSKKVLTPAQRIEQQLSLYEKEVLPSLLKMHNVDASSFKYRVLSAVKANEKLIEAYLVNPSSLFASILAAAELGLTPANGEFYLIPRKINNKPTIVPQIGYQGLVRILLRSPKIESIQTRCVFEGDTFEVRYGSEETIFHVPNLDVEQSSSTLKYVYATAFLNNKRQQFTILTKAQLQKLKSMSKYDNELYFNDVKDPEFWMLRKTALIQLSKLLPKDLYGSDAVDMANKIEGGAVFTLDESGKVKVLDTSFMPTLKKSGGHNFFQDLPEVTE
jgi:recombination protein RecT